MINVMQAKGKLASQLELSNAGLELITLKLLIYFYVVFLITKKNQQNKKYYKIITSFRIWHPVALRIDVFISKLVYNCVTSQKKTLLTTPGDGQSMLTRTVTAGTGFIPGTYGSRAPWMVKLRSKQASVDDVGADVLDVGQLMVSGADRATGKRRIGPDRGLFVWKV